MTADNRTTNPSTEQIEAEARDRFPELDPKYASLTYPAEAMRSHNRSAFESGARWAALVALDGAPEQHEHESVAPQPSESDVRERLVEAALETVDWDAIDAGEASPREAAGHAVWKALAALDGAPEPEAVEWEYAVGGMNPGSTEAWAHDEDVISSNFDTARAWADEAIASGSFSNAIVVKRRVNPWLPVEGESK